VHDSLRPKLTYANVMSTIAVFAVLGGTAWALAKNSVGSRQLKPNAVKNSDIADAAVKSPEVADGSLRASDFEPSELPAGPQGPPGEQGPEGDQGPPGEDATNLFGFISDNGDPNPTVLVYGQGVTNVVEEANSNTYLVTFDRSVTGCAVQATSGRGDPKHALTPFPPVAVLSVLMDVGPPDTVQVYVTSGTGAAADTSFFITAFCP
jgi:hypothetical protein